MSSHRENREYGLQPKHWLYQVLREENHQELGHSINALTPDGWEPIDYAIWARTTGDASHFVMMRKLSVPEADVMRDRGPLTDELKRIREHLGKLEALAESRWGERE